MKKVCCVFNYSPLYRLPIYTKMYKNFECDFYFGDNVFEPIKSFKVEELNGFVHLIHAKKIYKDYVWHSNIRDIFKTQYTYYIVTGSNNYLINWLLLFYCCIFRKNIYLWSHGTTKDKFSWLEAIKQKLFYRLATGVLLYGASPMDNLLKLGCKKKNLHIIHNSLDTEKQSELYEKLTKSSIYQDYFGNSNPVAIYIGRIQKRKKIAQLLHAIDYLNKNGKKVNLVLIGGESDDHSVSELIKQLDLSSQIWKYGPCYDEEKNAQLIYDADVCVSPGNVGLTAIHSLSYGTPVVTNNNFKTQMPEYEAIKDGETGSFFIEDDVVDLASKISLWTNLKEVERKKVRHSCRKTILKEWSVDYQIGILKEVLK